MHEQPTQLRRRASLEVLRAEAEDERSMLVLHRLRHGEDPWSFMDELPTVDELVVLALHAESVELDGLAPDRDRHHSILQHIAALYPALAAAAAKLRDDGALHARWDAVQARG